MPIEKFIKAEATAHAAPGQTLEIKTEPSKLFGFPFMKIDVDERKPSHAKDRLVVTVPPFLYFENGEGFICHGGELELTEIDLETNAEGERVTFRARAGATFRLLGEKGPDLTKV